MPPIIWCLSKEELIDVVVYEGCIADVLLLVFLQFRAAFTRKCHLNIQHGRSYSTSTATFQAKLMEINTPRAYVEMY